MQYRLVIVDRDGVLNQDSDAYIKSVHEWVPIPGSFEKLGVWAREGRLLAMASNQSAVARGLMTREALEALHQRLLTCLKAEGASFCEARYCLDDPSQPSEFRKPNPGMLLAALKTAQVVPTEVIFIGDSVTDYQAAQRAQIHFALVLTGKGLRTLEKYPKMVEDVPCFVSLAEVDLDQCEQFYEQRAGDAVYE